MAELNHLGDEDIRCDSGCLFFMLLIFFNPYPGESPRDSPGVFIFHLILDLFSGDSFFRYLYAQSDNHLLLYPIAMLYVTSQISGLVWLFRKKNNEPNLSLYDLLQNPPVPLNKFRSICQWLVLIFMFISLRYQLFRAIALKLSLPISTSELVFP
jgi:hypothetical protein